MTDRRARSARFVTAVVATIGLSIVTPTVIAPSALAAPGDSVAPVDTTEPVEDTTPKETDPVESVGTTEANDGGLVGVDQPGSRDTTAITWISIVAAVALIGLAAWWMLRRSGSDDFPPAPDDDWPSGSEVI